MPAAISVRNDEHDMTSKKADEAYMIPLWLPSQFARLKTNVHLIDRRLLELEWKLRTAQAYEALDQLRHHLQIRTHVFKFKDRFVRGQGANTRARDSLSTIQAKIDSDRDMYRAARSALVSLGDALGYSSWDHKLPALTDPDVRGISDGEDGQSEGKKQLPWIWKVMGVIGKDDGDLHLRDCASGSKIHVLCSFSSPALRIEWCKSRARAMRFSEEVELLLEENRRILQFFQWQESWWLIKAERKGDIPPMRREGSRAYALRQAALRAGLRGHFTHMWRFVQAYVNLS